MRKVVQISSGVAVVADNTGAAFQGRKALHVTYAPGPNANVSMASLYAHGRDLVSRPGGAIRNDGNATADVRADGVTLSLPTQSPTSAQKEAARITGLALEKVTVHPQLCGGGFGRRGEIDFVTDAVEVSKAIGAPVKVTWMREDDIRNDPYRPGTIHALAGSVAADGTIAAYRNTLACSSINARTSPARVKDGIDPQVLNGTGNCAYAIPNVLVDYHMLGVAIPGRPLARAVRQRQHFRDRIVRRRAGARAGRYPLAFRLGMLKPGRPRPSSR